MATVTVTRRSRNLGYGSSSQPVQRRNPETGFSWLEIEPITAPDVTGTVKAILAERQRAVRANSGHDWKGQLFVGGRHVMNADLALIDLELLTTRDPETGRFFMDSVTVEVE